MEGEKDFNEWLESVTFVDDAGEELSLELKRDRSIDREGDRARE